jgi:hypothetical protein
VSLTGGVVFNLPSSHEGHRDGQLHVAVVDRSKPDARDPSQNCREDLPRPLPGGSTRFVLVTLTQTAAASRSSPVLK